MPFHYCTARCSCHSSATGKECQAESFLQPPPCVFQAGQTAVLGGFMLSYIISWGSNCTKYTLKAPTCDINTAMKIDGFGMLPKKLVPKFCVTSLWWWFKLSLAVAYHRGMVNTSWPVTVFGCLRNRSVTNKGVGATCFKKTTTKKKVVVNDYYFCSHLISCVGRRPKDTASFYWIWKKLTRSLK